MDRRYIFILIILSGITIGLKNLYAASEFIPGIDGLPLMEGLVLIPEQQVFFETSNGRIVEVLASSGNSPRDIMLYYTETLKQLGWVPILQNEFRREEEKLSIQIYDHKTEKFVVRFSISPISD